MLARYHGAWFSSIFQTDIASQHFASYSYDGYLQNKYHQACIETGTDVPSDPASF